MRRIAVMFIALTCLTLGAASAQPDEALPQPDQKDQQVEEPTSAQPAPAPSASEQADAGSCSETQALAVDLSPSAVFQAGQSCGGATCGRGEYCCNPSCSICVPFGWSCTQESCN